MAASEVRIRQGFRLGLAHLGYAAIAFVFLLPLWWAVVSSLRPNTSVFADVFPFTAKALAPSPASLEAYEGVVQAGFGAIILNTLLVAALTTIAGLTSTPRPASHLRFLISGASGSFCRSSF